MTTRWGVLRRPVDAAIVPATLAVMDQLSLRQGPHRRTAGRAVALGLAAILCVALPCAAAAADWGTRSLPPFVLPTVGGGEITWAELGAGPVVLMFVAPGTARSNEAVELLRAALPDHPSVEAALVVPADDDAARALSAEIGVRVPTIVDADYLLASAFWIRGVPAALVLVDGRLLGEAGPEPTAEELEALLDALDAPLEQETAATAPGSEAGLPLVGENVGFLRLRGPTVLAVVGAHCPPCHEMLPQFFEIAERVSVCLVVTGELDEPERFRSDADHLTVVLDPSWLLAHLFDVHTTPTTFLLAPDGRLLWAHIGYLEGLAVAVDAIAP